MSTPTGPAVRRSALESAHAALGATWIAPDVRWPAVYAGVSGPSPIGLAEIGPREVTSVGGARLHAALAAAGLPFAPGRVSIAGNLEIWGVAPDEAWLIGGTPTGPGTAADARSALRDHGAAVTDIGAGLVQLRFSGVGIGALLEELCPVDLSPRALADGGLVGAPFANVRVMMARQDHPGPAATTPAVTILAPRDLAEYLWEVITETGAPHGLGPVIDTGGAR